MSRLLFYVRYFLATLAALVLLPVGAAAAATHTVSPGESLFLISRAYGTTVDALRQANGLYTDLIYPGQKLYIPEGNGKGSPGTYTVRPGDTLYLIGLRYGVSFQSIKAANGLRSDLIYPGQKLIIPAANNWGTSPAPVSRSAINSGPVNYSRSDFDLLARLITAEADSESYITKVAVGAVVLNRVKSSIFPNSIPAVIYQVDETGSYQFEPVLNGWINRPASEEAKRAALDALNGVDPTNGALYFFESWVPNSWLQSRPVSVILDSFTFTY
ncbi:LysM peptidoglycan-binding domain-containing protein [Desulfofundulus salinus]|uniref:LysM peptidoglycan-binding domain-containing protein n=1 Tax=Desulfofundulus salinus TaxID=2419843 RepID=A0A494WTY6_9FIRM|nr:LysM peptidoglycan-binding domain-containing protein [Desulfofundulus salinum]RKO66866.1 LysM peptidoglycan-binding domain-containing protein [Desulfofundulus salinum]